ncbi:MAG: tRNA (adenosine(37)-N6)-dimethylallyltransferase MiaA [Bacteroidales bacterium]
MNKAKKTLIVISGPTASGKTDLSIALAKHLNTEIISADSRQFYKEMKIGTAVPSDEQLQAVPHHFVGHLSILHHYNVYRFEKDALQKIHQLFKIYDLVILTGGSGLYVDAVCKGIDEMPDIPDHLRNKVDYNYRMKGLEYLRKYLKQHDPEYYREVDKDNPNRMKRGVEVCEATGKPFSFFRKKMPAEREFTIRKFGLLWEREVLKTRINQRTEQMMKQGWLEEAKRLFPYREMNALKTVGYNELFLYLREQISLDQAVENIKTQTRRYAKRQMTWLKRDQDIQWIDCAKPEDLWKQEILKKLRNRE